ncbi:hypothetical protein LJR039_006957 [Pseudorhodoferax sp. LjRoot39]
MDTQQKTLIEMCKQSPKNIQRKFTGSSLTIEMNCEKSINNNAAEMQRFVRQHGWIEKQRTEQVILYCLRDSGISLVADLDDRKQRIETIMRYPSANCESAFSVRQINPNN